MAVVDTLKQLSYYELTVYLKSVDKDLKNLKLLFKHRKPLEHLRAYIIKEQFRRAEMIPTEKLLIDINF